VPGRRCADGVPTPADDGIARLYERTGYTRMGRIWKTDAGGNHYNHVHAAAKPVAAAR